MKGRVMISHKYTRPFKYFQSILMVVWIIVDLWIGDNSNAMIPFCFLILFSIVNVFVVEASVDKDAIYILRWVKEVKYSLGQIDKIAEVKGGLTSLSILNEEGKTKHFLIMSSPELFTNPNQTDVYDFLLKLKMDYMKRQKETK